MMRGDSKDLMKAAKARAASSKAGYDISKARAMNWITVILQKQLVFMMKHSSLVAGKNADRCSLVRRSF